MLICISGILIYTYLFPKNLQKIHGKVIRLTKVLPNKSLVIALLLIIKVAYLYIHEYSLILIFWQINPLKWGNIATIDLFVFFFQTILGNLFSYFLEMIIFVREVCSLKKEKKKKKKNWGCHHLKS